MSAFLFSIILPSTDAEALAYVQSTLDSQYSMYMVYGSIVTAKNETVFFTRLSSQVYLEVNDFLQLGELVPRLLTEFNEN